jgi:hypothetical protein
MREDKVGEVYCTLRKKRNAINTLVVMLGGNNLLGRPLPKWENQITMNYKAR